MQFPTATSLFLVRNVNKFQRRYLAMHARNARSHLLQFDAAHAIVFPYGERRQYSPIRLTKCEGGNKTMRVVGRIRLDEFASQHADVRAQLDAWLCEVEDADWLTPTDIKIRFPSGSILSDNRVVFNLKGNRYRLEVKVSYEMKTVLVTRAGTHAEYTKWTF